MGTHRGSYGFTVGQRRGLNLQQPGADGNPRYVLSIRPSENTVVVGSKDMLRTSTGAASSPVWTAGAPPSTPFPCAVQLRAHGMTSPATVRLDAGAVTAILDVAQTGVAAGQALVMYDGDTVVGSGTLTTTE